MQTSSIWKTLGLVLVVWSNSGAHICLRTSIPEIGQSNVNFGTPSQNPGSAAGAYQTFALRQISAPCARVHAAQLLTHEGWSDPGCRVVIADEPAALPSMVRPQMQHKSPSSRMAKDMIPLAMNDKAMNDKAIKTIDPYLCTRSHLSPAFLAEISLAFDCAPLCFKTH